MTYEEAKALFEQDLKDGKCSDDCPECNARELAISAIEKQMPKHPKKKEETQYSTFYDCPCCGGYLVSKIDGELCCGQEYKYCYHCSQALDWSDTE